MTQTAFKLIALASFMAATVANAHEPLSRYSVENIEGWRVYVHRDLLDGGKHRESGVPAVRQLRYGLAKVRQMVADEPLKKLQRVKIWLKRAYESFDQLGLGNTNTVRP